MGCAIAFAVARGSILGGAASSAACGTGGELSQHVLKHQQAMLSMRIEAVKLISARP